MTTANTIRWKLHLALPPERVYAMLATDEGRVKFWPETSVEQDGVMEFTFQGEMQPYRFSILEQSPPSRFAFHYFGNTTATFELQSDGRGGTDLTLTETGFPNEAHRIENYAGWVTVLMNLKAAVDYGVDLRNHDPARTWGQGYCET
jgi:uncharacterized protein YndB with AHSA1/START domain